MQRGIKLKKVRLDRFVTQEEVFLLSRRKISSSRLSKIERGVVLPSKRDKKILCRVFKMSEMELFPEDEEAIVRKGKSLISS